LLTAVAAALLPAYAFRLLWLPITCGTGRVVNGVVTKPAAAGLRTELREINGELGLVGLAGDTPVGAISFDVDDEGTIVGLRFVVNPDKLRGLR
jgi:RNA polymerase sigma-70 factor (ECF subfamily)